jgi:hypothetical protein
MTVRCLCSRPIAPRSRLWRFLQVFINQADSNGNLNVTVLNVAGCSNAATNRLAEEHMYWRNIAITRFDFDRKSARFSVSVMAI